MTATVKVFGSRYEGFVWVYTDDVSVLERAGAEIEERVEQTELDRWVSPEAYRSLIDSRWATKCGFVKE